MISSARSAYSAAVVYTSTFNRRWRSDAVGGGPMSEIHMVDALVDGLRRLGTTVTVIHSLRAFARHAITRPIRWQRPLYVLDPAALELAARYHLLSRRHVERMCILEWFGTPPSLVSRSLPGLQTWQYLSPYPERHNTFLGFVLTTAAGEPIADAAALARQIGEAFDQKHTFQGVVWAKEGRYLDGDAGAAVRAVAEGVPLNWTIASSRLGGAPLPPNVTNHGVLARQPWRDLLRRSSFVMGVGDPVSGVTALEALVDGCAYLDPVYPSGRAVNGLPELTFRSQHPFASEIGRPFVHGIDIRDTRQVLAAVRASADTSARRAAAAQLVSALAPFTLGPYLERLRGILSR